MHRYRGLLGASAVAVLIAGLVASASGTLAAAAGRETSGVAFAPGSGQSVVDWNRLLIKIAGTTGAQPATVHPTRSFAILQAAEYDAVVSITHADRPYLFSVAAPSDARPDAAADQAAHDVLASLYPSFTAGPDQLLSADLASIPDGAAKQNGIEVGSAIAAHLLAARSSDGSAATPAPFVPGTQPGDYRPTPPKFPAPVFTGWGKVTPFVLERGDQFRPAPPAPITSAGYAVALNEVKSLGQDSSTTRTTDQTAAARFWGAAPIWNVWNQIAQRMTLAHDANLETAAKVFSKLDLALGDTTIGLYDGKYHYQVWRPVTAIRMGASANNPDITGDPAWTPLAVTAPDPSYPGAHSGLSEAAATVLEAFYGGHEQVSVTSDGMPGVARMFSSFERAATEAGLSRIFAGQHTRLDHNAGQELGEQVARFVLHDRDPLVTIAVP